MKLYKFRSLDDKSINYTLDILSNEKLYCASYSELNDPLEGVFFSLIHTGGGLLGSPFSSILSSPLSSGILGSVIGGGESQRRQRTLSEIPALNGQHRICSLSKNLSDIRMWSHYADSHKGIAIEINFEENLADIVEVIYNDDLQKFKHNNLSAIDPKSILSTKTHHWDYEEECRIITGDDFYNIKGKITAVYAGIRVSPDHIEKIKSCTDSNISIYSTRLDTRSIEVKEKERISSQKAVK